jgi:5,10-methylene-tetrahydrofolate dehydrogenase/methenyl tetrahydrofolate cyclohydrolase
MPTIAHWTEAERDLFSHKLEELIHGPNPDQKIGFILITFPITEASRASMTSNTPVRMIQTVMYSLLKGLVERPSQ